MKFLVLLAVGGLASFLPARCVADVTLWLSTTNDNGDLVFSWPGWATDAVLEEASDIQPPAVWTPVAPGPYSIDISSLNYSFRVAANFSLDQNKFYRLHRISRPVPGMTGRWPLDGGTSAAVTDQSLLGNTLWTTNTSLATGRAGSGSLAFNGLPINAGGSAAWVNNSNFQVLPPNGGPFSLSLWFSPDALTPGASTIAANDESVGKGWRVALNTIAPGTDCIVVTGGGAGSSLSVTGQTLVLPQQWHHLVVTYATNQTCLFLDRRLLAQGPATLLNNDGPFWFGSAPGSDHGFQGRLLDIRAYTNALTQDQISLTGEWHFDENTGSMATDTSVGSHLASVPNPAAWAPGRSGAAIDLSVGPVIIPNDDCSVLPPSGAPFGLSFWIRPHSLSPGRSGLLSCADGNSRGWEATISVEGLGVTWFEVTSTNLGGTLSLRAQVALTEETWTKVDLNHDGGMTTLYVNGTQVASELGAIQGANAPLVLGRVPGTTNFNGLIDELKIYGREREAAEIGPVALPMWEMALVNSVTNMVLAGSGPPGKPLYYSILTLSRGSMSYTPGSPNIFYVAGSAKGPDSLVYTVSDGDFVSPPATVAISVVEPHWLSTNGGTAAVLDGSSPDAAWVAGSADALDAIWRTNNFYDCFFYAPGEYDTTGWKIQKQKTALPGCKHIGSGSEGTNATIIKLVNALSPTGEGLIFANLFDFADSDGFEVRNLVLDCNAANNPKYVLGEPVLLQIPLTTTTRVDSVTLQWGITRFSINGPVVAGPPVEFSLGTRTVTPDGYLTNWQALTSTGSVDVLSVTNETDEILLLLTRRPDNEDLYSLAEVDVSGATVSLPQAKTLGGDESRLDAAHSILKALDIDFNTAWASGSEDQVKITLPLQAHTAVNQINLVWNNQTLPDLRRLGPAAQFQIFARDENTGQVNAVPFYSNGRSGNGSETISLGTSGSPITVFTDQLNLLLVSRDTGVDYYSLQEIDVPSSSPTAPTVMRMPSGPNSIPYYGKGTFSFLQAFDGDTNTAWVGGLQGSLAAVNVHGSNLKFTGLKVIGFGAKVGTECFLLSIHPYAGPYTPISNVLVEDCLFTQPGTRNSEGLSTVTVTGIGANSLQNAIVRRCTVSGVRSYFLYSHGFGATRVENCRVEDCQTGIYFEPGSEGSDSVGGTVLIRSNAFINVDQGIYMFFHPQAPFESLFCQGNEIVLNAGPGYGIAACDVCVPGPNGIITNLLALNNIIRFSDWAPHPDFLKGGLACSDIHHAVFGNNVVALGGPNSLRLREYPAGSIPGTSTYPPPVDPLPPGYRRAWFCNHDLSGTLLPVRFYDSGVDGLASQQQWPE
jgi:hypothetical protein